MTVTAGETSVLATRLRPLVLSLRPRFAESILNGTKTVELRRTRLSAPEGTCLILYASAPVMAVLGTAILAGRDTDTPEKIWRRHRRAVGLSRAEYEEYLAGARLATAVTVVSPQRLAMAYTLSALRNQAPFQPPQSFRFLSEEDPAQLHDMAAFSA